jgi:hypothetical protein
LPTTSSGSGRGRHRIDVFNLAALLGLGAVTAGRIGLHRTVVALGGAVALWVAAVSLAVVLGAVPPVAGLVLALAVGAGYVLVLAPGARLLALLRLPTAGWPGCARRCRRRN